jgi:hypothetical protein
MGAKVRITPAVDKALHEIVSQAPKTLEEALRVKEFKPIPAGMKRADFENRMKKNARLHYHLAVRRKRR